MDKFKIENFKTKNPTERFPSFKELDNLKCKKICDEIIMRYGLVCQSSLEMVRIIDSYQEVVEGLSADNESFKLQGFFNHLDIKPEKNVFINWYRYDQIDSILWDDFVENFDYIWYPSADDIDIFDNTFDWILSVKHNGVLKILTDRRVLKYMSPI